MKTTHSFISMLRIITQIEEKRLLKNFGNKETFRL
jgi:hypothetical protein